MQLIKFDFMQGIKNKYYKYIIAVIMYVFICFIFCITYNSKNELDCFSIGDILMFFFRGERINKELSKNVFPSPVYMIIQMLMAYIVGNYCYRDFKERARYVVTKSGNRCNWFASKIMWAEFSITTAYILMFGVVCVCCMLNVHGEISMRIHQSVISKVCNLGEITVDMSEIILNITLVPYIIQICIAIIQISLELLFNPMISYIIVMAVIIMSAYYRKFIFIGNGFMIINNECIQGGCLDGINMAMFSIACALVIAFISYMKFRKIDIL